MTKQVQRRRGTSTQHTSFTGAEGEISVNTTNKSIHVHDGTTAGGVEAARADLANVSDTSLNNALSGNTLASLTITSADINGGTIDGTTIGGTSAAAVTTTSLVATTADINGGTVDGTVIGGSSAAAGTFTTATATTGNITTVNATTVDTTNIEVTTLKAKDGTSAGSIADSTGVVTLASSVLTTTDINGGTVDGAVIGGSSPAAVTGTTITATGDVTIADKIIHAGDTNTAIRFPAADTVTVETSGAERMRVDSSGNVGVGTTDPTTLGGGSKLTVNQGADGNIVFARGGSTRQVQLGTSSTMGYINADNASGGLGFNVNGSERARIDSSGNLLVGTTSQYGSQKLSLNGGIAIDGRSAVTPGLSEKGDDNTGVFWPAADSLGFSTGGTERARITSAGDLLVGTTTAGYSTAGRGLIEVNGSSSALVAFRTGGTNRGYLYTQGTDMIAWAETGNFTLGTAASALVAFTTNNTERVRIDASGRLLVGTTVTNFGARLTAFSDSSYTFESQRSTTGSEGHIAFVNANGAVGSIFTNGTSTAFNTSSDYRLKENVQPMQDALAKIAQLNPVTYTWKASGSDGQGFIAHELQAVVPDCVTGEKDAVDEDGNPQYQGVDTSFLVATLVKAVQELKAEVDSLRAQLNP